MAINPPSDIVLDVVRAADPSAMRVAAGKLNALGTMAAAAGDTFAAVLGGVSRLPEAALPFAPEPAMTARHNGEALAAGRTGKANPYQQFEGFVLQTFIQSMLPKDSDAVFGAGNAGSIWKSMLAEQIAGQLAKSGGIGIAAEVQARRQPNAAAPIAGGLI